MNKMNKKIKRIIKEVVKKKLKYNLIDKENKLINKDNLIKKFKLENSGLKLNTHLDIKNIFRYIEVNNAIPRSIDMIYRTFVEEKNFERCSGYELIIDPLNNIKIYCSESKYNNIIKGKEKVKQFLENPNNSQIVKVYKENDDMIIEFNYNIYESEEYKNKILRVIGNILSEIFSLCDNPVIPLQITLYVYSDKNLRLENDEIEGMHRTFVIFKKDKDMYRGYYYDPEGYNKSYYIDMIYSIINNLKYNNLEIRTIHTTCPIGIQKILKDVDFGLCTIYCHFWYHCFIEILYIIKLHEKRYNTETFEGDMTKYVEYLNKCIIKQPYKMHLENVNGKYYVDYKGEPNLDNKLILQIYLNYAMYIIGYTYKMLNNKERIDLIKYIKNQ